MKIYVDITAAKYGDGTEKRPFTSIMAASRCAMPGDEILVYPGIYREYVDPVRAGRPDARITYRSIVPNAAVITGAERISTWENYEGSVWVARIPNQIFHDYNPYTTRVEGDWFDAHYISHTGDVYLNSKPLYEAMSLEKILKPELYRKSWFAEDSLYCWYTTQDTESNETLIYANFHEFDPNKEVTEILVRENCFYPSREGIGYITLSGFFVDKAATQWAPPTAYQEGMVGPHWSKGWIIEDCEIAHSKCSGISLGKYRQPENDNKWSKLKFKDGTQTERDCICQAQREGWNKENIGSHIIRRCNIHDCGQTGIVGHLGGVFSIIENNHIHHINNKQNLAGAEIGGIKMHAAIDVIIRGNHFHHCTRGLWLDWQAQGTRVTGNLFHHNTLAKEDFDYIDNIDVGEDIFIEVSHGPTLVDNNILLSDFSLKLPTQGVAVVHNLIHGSITAVGRGVDNGSVSLPSPRFTPYHVPHRTEIAGFMTILHGDIRFYNNIFVQKELGSGIKKFHDTVKDSEWTDANLICGTIPYEDYPNPEEYAAMFEGYCGMGSEASDRYYTHLPVWTGGNVYFNGATPISRETDAAINSRDRVRISLESQGNEVYLCTDLYASLPESSRNLISTETLGEAFEPEQKFENPDGTPILFNVDFAGTNRNLRPLPGPFAEGISRIRVF